MELAQSERMSTSTSSLPRPSFSAHFPQNAGNTKDVKGVAAKAEPAQLAERGMAFVKSHWKQIGLAALGLLGWRSARMRPLLRKAAMMYALPAAKKAFAAARR